LTEVVRTFERLDDETIVARVVQACDPILDANKEDANHAANRSPSGDLWHVARIPIVVAEKWLNEHGVDVLNPDHRAAVRRLLNSNEYRWLRTGGGRI